MNAYGTLQPLDKIKCDNNWQGILLCRMALRLSDLHLHKSLIWVHLLPKKNAHSTLIPWLKRYSTAASVWGLNAFQRPIALLLSGWRTCTLLAVDTGAVFK